ncbi:hypothetical protein RQP46_000483 [Phenoliferia psychrophenolica]
MSDPKPLDGLSPQQIKAIKSSILTEHFGWAPETFAKQGIDIANVAMYAATEAIEASLMEKAGPPHNLDEEEIQKGVFRLETLLESTIDRQFDLYEIWVLRNTFEFDLDLIPYIVLKHQEHIDESLRDTDKEALEEYETEMRLYEAELQKERELACAAEFVRRNLEDVKERASQVGYMRGADPINGRTRLVVSQLSGLQDRVATLLDTPLPHSKTVAPDPADPWGSSRSTYINATASSKVDAITAAGTNSSRLDDTALKGIGEANAKTGGSADAQALLESLGEGSS